MAETLLLCVFFILFGGRLLTAAAVIAGSGWYDALYNAPASKTPRNRKPSVAVVIVARNQRSALSACLASVLNSTYQRRRVIVVDNSSADDTKPIIKQVMRRQPDAPIQLLTKRKPAPFTAAAGQGLRKCPEAELTLAIDASSRLAPDTLTNAVQRFRAAPELEAVRLNARVLPSPSLFGLWQQFKHLAAWQGYKLRALLHRDKRTAYPDNAIIRAQPEPSFRSFARGNTLQCAVALADMYLTVYAVYVAYWLQRPLLLTTIALLLTGWLGFAVWGASRMPLRQKLLLSTQIPAVCLLFVIQKLIRLFAWPLHGALRYAAVLSAPDGL